MYHYNLNRGTPTVKPHPSFNVEENGTALRNAMKGFGTDEEKLIKILTNCSNQQRLQLVEYFKNELNRNLEDDLRSELSGKFESLIVGLIYPPIEYLARQLNKAMRGAGTDNSAVIEILCTRNNEELKQLVATYEKLYNRPLAEHICSETSGEFRRFLTLIVTGVRNPPGKVSPERAKELAEELYKAGEGKFGTSIEVFNKIMAHESYEQLKLVFEEYKSVSGHTIEQALKKEISGELLEAMLAVVECVQSQVTFFARRIERAMKGLGTDDTTLIRIIVSRSEIDLGDVKREYERLYDKTLESAIKTETSGDYKKAFVALLGGA